MVLERTLTGWHEKHHKQIFRMDPEGKKGKLEPLNYHQGLILTNWLDRKHLSHFINAAVIYTTCTHTQKLHHPKIKPSEKNHATNLRTVVHLTRYSFSCCI